VAAYWSARSRRAEAQKEPERPADAEPVVRIEEFLRVDPMELEIGFGLLRLADRSRGGDLVERLQQLRQDTAQNLGIILPKVRVRDNLELGPQDFTVRIRGKVVSRGSIPAERWLVRDVSASALGPFSTPAPEDLFGPSAWWVDSARRTQLQRQGQAVIDPAGAILHHLRVIIERHADDLLSRDQVKRLLDSLKQTCPALVEEVIPTLLSAGQVHRVLQNLLGERRSIRDLETILEALGDQAAVTKDLDALTEHIRRRLDRQMVSRSREEQFAAAVA
ncbi:MAG: FHIPEP family type III secretion protein, partial [Planctomycetes bacterium]|nr:FHIPEP family type III secretion protein [Planctomycetota bacterium]